MSANFTLFDTRIGLCGIAWNDAGIFCTQLPEGDEIRSRARFLKRVPGAREASPPPEVQAVIGRIVALLDPKSLNAHEILSSVYAANSRNDDAEREYHVALQLFQQVPADYKSLAFLPTDPLAKQ